MILFAAPLGAGQIKASVARDTLVFPMGEISFADTVIQYDPGALGLRTGGEPDSAYMHPECALGVPDYDSEKDTGYVSLGAGGSLVLKFNDNVLIDGPGPDICLIQREGDNESVFLWISEDGRRFIFIGKMTKENPSLDIGPYAKSGVIYPYVKLRDDPDQGTVDGPALGADIDALGALNTAIKIVVPAHRLFTGKTASLNDEAYPILGAIADRIRHTPRPRVSIRMYTDNRGSEDFNAFISQTQAEAVQKHFVDTAHLTNAIYASIGYGETHPIAVNDTEEGRRRNCRMEILIQMDFR